MVDHSQEAILRPIGMVKSVTRARDERLWESLVSEISLDPAYEAGLEGIDAFSHVVIIYWMHLLEAGERELLKVHPRRNSTLPLVGVFATRSPARPNPLGMAVARLLRRRGNMLTVVGLDALDGTPVIDIKPYLPSRDCVAGAVVPGWVKQDLEARHSLEDD